MQVNTCMSTTLEPPCRKDRVEQAGQGGAGWRMVMRSIPTPVGSFALIEEDGAITGARWQAGHDAHTPLLDEAARQLAAYFDRRLTVFDLPLVHGRTEAQARFGRALCAIPYGETRTYGQMAKALDISAQAAGQLCGANPIAILIPCHRVTGTGHLGGFSAPGGVETKVALLKLEGAASLLL
jgi:methylated-DNA-[protein]-cysteine S-methyltransferase